MKHKFNTFSIGYLTSVILSSIVCGIVLSFLVGSTWWLNVVVVTSIALVLGLLYDVICWWLNRDSK